MKRFIKLIVFISALLSFFVITPFKVNAASYLADKTEVEVKLEVSGANSLCQTDDGYIWIGQYSGLTRYDSKEFVTFTNFEENGISYNIKSVKTMTHFNNTLYFSSADHLYKYENGLCHNVDLGIDNYIIRELFIDEDGILYVSSTKGLIIYDTINKKPINTIDTSVLEAIVVNGKMYYQKTDGLYNSESKKVYSNDVILDLCSYGNILLIGHNDGTIRQYDTETETMLEKEFKVTDQINKLYYSAIDRIIFVGGENGLYIVDPFSDKETFVASNLSNSKSIVDLILDYEGNLWITSYDFGVSMLTKNALSDVLFDVPITEMPINARVIYAVEAFDGILYITTNKGIYLYDVKNEKLLENNPIMDKIDEYIATKYPDPESEEAKSYINSLKYMDVEEYNGKLYFAAYGIGLVEYDKKINKVNIYDGAYMNSSSVSNYDLENSYSYFVRCLRAYDGFLLIGYTRGMIKYSGTSFKVVTFSNQYPLYLGYDNDGNINFVYNHIGLSYINNDLDPNSIKPVGNVEGTVIDGVLKFLYDGDDIYYNSFGRLFKSTKNSNGTFDVEEISVPYVKGSIVEMSKVNTTINGVETTKYVIASQSQIYIADSLKNGFENYQFFDSTNGLKSGIAANTSGYYDSVTNKYYFQSSNGIYSYDFEFGSQKNKPLKIAINSVSIDDNVYYGNNINVKKNAERISFNISVFGFRPNKGYKIYYKLDGVDKRYITADENTSNITYTNLKGGKYKFHLYVLDEYEQMSNQIEISFNKTKHIYEHVWFVVLVIFLALFVLVGSVVLYFRRKVKQSIKRQLEYKKITLESIEAIARTIDVKDSYTNGHSRRVGYYSREIAKAMGLDEKQVENIFYTALLHDIGKIGIPISIINKPSRLSDEEFEIMKTHTTKGGKILKDISTIPGIVEGAMYHHEKYNGTGYPNGLKGEEIPLIARIICCADCFDAMATRRSYKEPCTKEYIISEFKRCSGTQFDPEIAKVMVKLIEEDKFKTIMEEDIKHKNDDVITIEDSKDGE